PCRRPATNTGPSTASTGPTRSAITSTRSRRPAPPRRKTEMGSKIAVLLIALSPAAFGATALKLKPAPKDVESERKGPARFKAPTSEEDVQRDAAADKKRDELIEELKT